MQDKLLPRVYSRKNFISGNLRSYILKIKFPDPEPVLMSFLKNDLLLAPDVFVNMLKNVLSGRLPVSEFSGEYCDIYIKPRISRIQFPDTGKGTSISTKVLLELSEEYLEELQEFKNPYLCMKAIREETESALYIFPEINTIDNVMNLIAAISKFPGMTTEKMTRNKQYVFVWGEFQEKNISIMAYLNSFEVVVVQKKGTGKFPVSEIVKTLKVKN